MSARFMFLAALLVCLAIMMSAVSLASGSTEKDLTRLSQIPRGKLDNFPVFRSVHSGHEQVMMDQIDYYNNCDCGGRRCGCYYNHRLKFADEGSELRRLVFKFGVPSRIASLKINAAPYYAVRPIVVNRHTNSGLYYLGVDPDGRDMVRQLAVNEAGGYPLYPFGGGDIRCDCSTCTVSYNILSESFMFEGGQGPFYRSDGHVFATNCRDGSVFGVMFDSYLLSPVYQPFTCNARGEINFHVPFHGSLGFQCVGPVYGADGTLIWPEACFSLGDADGSGSGVVGENARLARNRWNYTPFMFDVGTNTPIRIRDHGPVPTLRDFSYALGTIRYRLLDESGNPIGDWVAVNGRGVMMIPVGIDRVEIDPPQMVRLAARFSGRDVSKDDMKRFRAQIAVARLDIGKWDVVWDSGVVAGDGPAPQPSRFVLRGLYDLRGALAIRGVGGWWRNTGGGVWWYSLWDLEPNDVYPGFFVGWKWWGFTGYGTWCSGIGDIHWCGNHEARGAPIYNLGNAQDYLFDGGPKGASIYSPMGWEITGTAFQVFLTVVPYEVVPPDNVPGIEAAALQEASGSVTSGAAYGLPVDAIHRAGVRYRIPQVQATLVFTDELGVQRVGVMLNNAVITSTITHMGMVETTRLDGSGAVDHWLPARFYARERGLPPADTTLVVRSPSSGASVSWQIQYRLYGDVTVWYRFADGTVQPIPLRVFLPPEGRYERSGSIPIVWLREER